MRPCRLVNFDLPVRVATPQISGIGVTAHPRRVHEPTDSRAPLESRPQRRLGLKGVLSRETRPHRIVLFTSPSHIEAHKIVGPDAVFCKYPCSTQLAKRLYLLVRTPPYEKTINESNFPRREGPCDRRADSRLERSSPCRTPLKRK